MRNKVVWVVTDVDLGWDCVVGVYDTREAAEAQSKKSGVNNTVIHEEALEGMLSSHTKFMVCPL